MRTPADKEPPLFAPAEFKAEHLDEARRTVIRSCMERSRAQTVSNRLSGSWSRWPVAVLIVVSVSLGVTMLVLSRIEASHRRGDPD